MSSYLLTVSSQTTWLARLSNKFRVFSVCSPGDLNVKVKLSNDYWLDYYAKVASLQGKSPFRHLCQTKGVAELEMCL